MPALWRMPKLAATLMLAALLLTATTVMPRAASAAEVDDFSYASWDARFELSLDADGRSHLHATETIVARFPRADQNRGIVRGLTLSYQGAGTDTRVLSVTDENGTAVPYETEEDDGLVYVLTGTDDYVHGQKTYVIEYRMRDVILAADTGVDEFYWDLLPLDSTQPIERFHAEVVLDGALAGALSGSATCYSGRQGERGDCELAGPVLTPDSAAFTVDSGPREGGDGVTVAIGLAPATATQPPARLPDPVADVVPLALGGVALLLSGASSLAVAAFTRSRRRATGVVVAQFDVPESLPPLLAARVIPAAKSDIEAEIVHLAVRGALRIEDGPDGPRLRRMTALPREQRVDAATMEALFTEADAAGVTELPRSSEEFAARIREVQQTATEEAAAQGLISRERSTAARVIQVFALAAAAIGIGIGGFAALSGRESAQPGLFLLAGAAIAVLVTTIVAFSARTVLTRRGAETYEYLLGVKEFIRVAEADRIRMLQSYSGAERRADGVSDVVVLYERLLPYAMLFGQEREWGGVLENAYRREERSASWLHDANDADFVSSLLLFTTATRTSTSYAAPSADSSSSAGGSFGGGFSGGGGGGGFSGGR